MRFIGFLLVFLMTGCATQDASMTEKEYNAMQEQQFQQNNQNLIALANSFEASHTPECNKSSGSDQDKFRQCIVDAWNKYSISSAGSTAITNAKLLDQYTQMQASNDKLQQAQAQQAQSAALMQYGTTMMMLGGSYNQPAPVHVNPAVNCYSRTNAHTGAVMTNCY